MSLRDELLRRFPALEGVRTGSWAVGGAVRDLLRGADPADVDVACAAPRERAEALGGRAIRLGDGEPLEAWRVALDGRVYDFAVLDGGSIETDLARRDFTVNAMAVDLERGDLVDPYGGASDVRRGIVRMIRASNFDDDPLRTLRAVRFAVALGFAIEPATIEAVRVRAGRILEVAAERVTSELTIVLTSGALRRAVQLLRETQLDVPLGLDTREVHADEVSLAGAYAILVRDPRTHARRWRWSEALLRSVASLQRLVENHDPSALYETGEAVARQLPAVLRALGRDAAVTMPDFSIEALLDGDEIGAVTGLPPGRELGEAKRALVEAQVRGAVRTREDAEQFLRARRG